jgi:2-polyprenyl-3-methyl-5-hydroxy-6-metoxy-1,4-benzoquinol methylase
MDNTEGVTQDQIALWTKAQQGETSFWRDWMTKNPDLTDTNWLKYVLNFFGLADNHDFGKETLVDIGSGPIGILTRFKAECRIAVDPLPIDSFDKSILRIKMPAEKTGLPSKSADRIFIYNLLQHVISPQHVLDECMRLLKPNATVYLLEQLNLPTDSEHPHSLKIEMFDKWVERERLEVIKRTLIPDSILSSVSASRPGSGYYVLCLIVKKPA